MVYMMFSPSPALRHTWGSTADVHLKGRANVRRMDIQTVIQVQTSPVRQEMAHSHQDHEAEMDSVC